MKRNFFRLISMMVVSFFLAFVFSMHVSAHSNGAPAGYTGSPGDGHNCTSCHGGTAVPVTGWITTNIPAQGYTAGNSYTITVTVTGTGNKGFEVSPQNATGTQLGVLAAGTGSKLVGGTKYVTHTSPGSYSGTAIWNFTWTAPAAGTGSVTLYGAMVVGQPNVKITTTTVGEYVLVPLAVVATATPPTIIQGCSSQLNAAASGGSGTYTYAWTSVPAGFTSASQSPVVQPNVTTKYLVNVNDGSQTKKDSVTVTVTAVPLTATASANPSLICLGQTSQLNVIPVGGSGTYTYSWTSLPAGFTSTQQNPVVSPTVATQYIAHVSDGSGSFDASTNVTVNQPATSAAGNDTTCPYATTQVPLHGSATNYASVLWTTSGTGTFSAATSLAGLYYPSTADKTSGNITLTLTVTPQSPCATAAISVRHVHFDGPSGIEAIRPLDISISPNPSTGLFAIGVNSSITGDATITVSDMQGKNVIQHSWTPLSAQTEKLDLSGYPKGMYILHILTGNVSATRKLVIE